MSFHFDIFNYEEAAREMQLSVWLSKLKYNNRPNWAKDTLHQNEFSQEFKKGHCNFFLKGKIAISV